MGGSDEYGNDVVVASAKVQRIFIRLNLLRKSLFCKELFYKLGLEAQSSAGFKHNGQINWLRSASVYKVNTD